MSSYERIWSQALGGKPLSGELERLHQEHVAEISNQNEALHNAIEKAEHLRSDIPADYSANLPACDDLFISAKRQISTAQEALAAATKAFNAFRFGHGKLTLPNTPSSLETAMVCGVMIFVESLINASFFLNAHLAAGPLAALTTSTLISATNVFVSASAGYFIGRYLHYGLGTDSPDSKEFKGPRNLAARLHIIFLVFIGFFNLTVGLVRAQEELFSVRHGLSEYWQLLTTPESFFLVLIGCCMSALAWHKGKHGFDDPYAGYGAMQRSVERAEDRLDDVMEDYSEEISARYDEAFKAAQNNSVDLKDSIKKYNDAVCQCARLDMQLRQLITHIEASLRTEISKIANQYAGASDEEFALDPAILHAFCDLSGGLDYRLPVALPLPDTHDTKARFDQAKEQALSELMALFDE